MMKNLLKRTLLAAAFLLLAVSAFGADTSTHTLQKGETLYSVSRLYKVPYEALVAANGITDPTKLKVGTVLVIPLVHLVGKGETLFGLSKQYGITIAELLSANKLSQGYVLKIGDTLIIPVKKSEAAPAASTVPVASPPLTSTSLQATSTTLPTTSSSLPTPTPSTTIKQVPTPIATSTSQATAETTSTLGTTTSTSLVPPVSQPVAKPQVSQVPMPEPVKTQNKTVDLSMGWPAAGKAVYLDGKLEGIMILAKKGDATKAVAGGTVVSAGPSRGFNQVVFVQAKSGYVYVYGGNETLSVKTGDTVLSGKELGRIGVDASDGVSKAFFFVFRNGQPIDPATAPRD